MLLQILSYRLVFQPHWLSSVIEEVNDAIHLGLVMVFLWFALILIVGSAVTIWLSLLLSLSRFPAFFLEYRGLVPEWYWLATDLLKARVRPESGMLSEYPGDDPCPEKFS
jgi:hypothetical protein